MLHLDDPAVYLGAAAGILLVFWFAARAVAGGIDSGAALVVGTSKGSVENWLDAAGDVGRRQVGLADIAAAVAGRCGLRGPRTRSAGR